MSYYDILGVSPTSNEEELTEAYERLSSALDSLVDQTPKSRHIQTEIEQRRATLHSAWSVLGDAERRDEYDRQVPTIDPITSVPLPAYRVPGPDECRLCGSTPTAEATLSSQIAFVYVRFKREIEGPFCHSCGAELARQHLIRTALGGWWGIYGFYNPWHLWRNFRARARFRRLDPPVPTPGVFAPLRAPLAPR
jgi:hypothetical protein